MSRTDCRFLTQLQACYSLASKKERTAILDGFVKTTGYHRKHTIAVLNRRPERVQGPIRRPRRCFQRTGPRTPPRGGRLRSPRGRVWNVSNAGVTSLSQFKDPKGFPEPLGSGLQLRPRATAASLFIPARRALMRGDHPRQHEPIPTCSEGPGRRYALLIDVAGEEESEGSITTRLSLENPRRDATALSVVEVEARFGQLPAYRTVDRKLWLGTKHTALHAQILALVDHWHAAWLVVDATGIGAGLASFLTAARPALTIPAIFSPKTKSDMGWNFVGSVETSRYREYLDESEPDPRQFWYEVEHCQYEILPGPGERIKWGVWESPSYDGAIARGHDDLLISAALCTILDNQDWTGTGSAEIIHRLDPLAEIDRATW